MFSLIYIRRGRRLTEQMLLQTFIFLPGRWVWWAGPDLNRRPLARKANVLTKLDDRPSHFLFCFHYTVLN